MSPNFRMSLILSFLFISSCSQFEANEKQEQEPIIAQTSMTAALGGYLHFTDNCIIVRAKDGGEGVQLAILGDEVISDLTENSLVYQGKKYTESDYIRVGGGYVNYSAAFKKEHNLGECSGLEIFIPN